MIGLDGYTCCSIRSTSEHTGQASTQQVELFAWIVSSGQTTDRLGLGRCNVETRRRGRTNGY